MDAYYEKWKSEFDETLAPFIPNFKKFSEYELIIKKMEEEKAKNPECIPPEEDDFKEKCIKELWGMLDSDSKEE